jgi:ABC-type uncharacterized transport system auxiliary subunit
MLDLPADPSSIHTRGAPVRLRPVHEASFLRERIVWRVSDVEYGRYEQRRWNELPAQYLARAMTNALQQNPALALTDDVAAPALALDLLAFDEVVAAPQVARIVVRATLRRPKGGTLLDRQFVVEEPIASDSGSDTARAMGRALDRLVGEVTTEVAARLAPAAPAPHRTKR